MLPMLDQMLVKENVWKITYINTGFGSPILVTLVPMLAQNVVYILKFLYNL